MVTSFCERDQALKAKTVGAGVSLTDRMNKFYAIILYQLLI